MHILIGLIVAICVQNSGWAFEIIWNTPSRLCIQKRGVHIPLEEFGIKVNTEHHFVGEEAAVFYHMDLGLYPHVAKKRKIIHGGIPQAADLQEHLRRMRKAIEEKLPDPNFSGVGVLDWEGWRPLWKANWSSRRIYQDLSIKRVKKTNPDVSRKSAKMLAEKQFEKAAKEFLLQSLELVKKLRPKGKWGIYGYPTCNWDAQGTCKTGHREFNEKLDWLFNASTGLFPTTYLRKSMEDWSDQQKHLYIQAVVQEARVFSKNGQIPVYPFSRISYRPYDSNGKLYTQADLCSSLSQMKDLGCRGVLVWGSWRTSHLPEDCRRLASYVPQLLGPYSRFVIQEAQEWSRDRCHGRGACVFPPRPFCVSAHSPSSSCHCECRQPYKGDNCQERA